MNLCIAGFKNEIEFNNTINVLVIRNRNLLVKTIMELNNIINYQTPSKDIILYDKDKIVDMSKNIFLVFDVFNIDVNSKNVLNQLYTRISNIVELDNRINQDYNLLVGNIVGYVREKLNDLPFEYDINKNIQPKDILKLLSLKINMDKYNTLQEKIMFLVDVISEFKIASILTLVGINNYFEQEILEEIYKYAKCRGINLLLIENDYPLDRKSIENILYIDEDFDDFMI